MSLTIVTSLEQLIDACRGFDTVGFHGTSSLACQKIETNGFLPDKIFSDSDRDDILSTALRLEIDTSGYRQWIAMRSTTFTKQVDAAINHVRSGHSGGQGLINVQAVLQSMQDKGTDADKEFAQRHLTTIQNIRDASRVIYAVDLSGFGKRIVDDEFRSLYQYHLNPNVPLPATGDIGPQRLIARLDLK
ncbi:hypothetical protein [Pandoraea apista]|uniref:hypothetical protein n=1 Tax=Pandoraea apista TaxID=93218 RepID=UPI00058AB023|nr:hypothetical protein [Pandoraea apista]AJE98838.1 hypothetical protein SG18_12730 [Pandoraea apista]AKH72917.1 hypothetical protein XM39_12925 [Pandoraea apista]AKI61302.1 hypothetical protein AA956_05185 [Pandoraea apista]